MSNPVSSRDPSILTLDMQKPRRINANQGESGRIELKIGDSPL
jgi:hypothetical protein